MSEEKSEKHEPPPHYGTFQHHHHQEPAVGFPQPASPPGITGHPSHGYQSVPGHAVSEGAPFQPEHKLACCGIGYGWFFFIIGFFLAGIPWYLATLVIIFSNIDPREKPGYIACILAAILGTLAVIFGATN